MSSSPGISTKHKIRNRVVKIEETTKAVGTKLKNSITTVARCAGAFPPLKSALDDMSELVGILEDIVEDDGNLCDLLIELQSRVHALESYIAKLDSEAGNGSISLIAKSINENIKYIKEHKKKGTLRSHDAVKRTHKIEGLLKRLHDDVELRTWENTAKQLEESFLMRLSPVYDAGYNSSYARTIQRGSCTPGTRQDLQKLLHNWAQHEDSEIDDHQPTLEDSQAVNENAAKVFWMNGMAGTGKTTIAYSLCEWLETNAQLGASFFCSRTSTSCQSIDKIVPTIAYQLGRFSPAYRSALCKALQDDPDAATRDVRVQFDRLITKPVNSISRTIPNGVVVVIDALDECEDEYGAELILDLLLTHALELPIKFFIASRPEPTIREKILSSDGAFSSVFHLHDIEASVVEGDIQKYLTDALKHMSPPPTNDQLFRLAKQSGKLFVYASTLVRYISPRGGRAHSKSRLQKILAIEMQTSTGSNQPNNLYKELDRLYSTVLNLAFAEALENEELTIIQDVLQTVVCTKEPLAVGTLAGLLGTTAETVSYSLGSLYSVLHVTKEGGLISTLHASFPDFLFDQARAGHEYYCDKTHRNKLLTQRCFGIMKEELRFNICELESSFIVDNDVPNLQAQLQSSISPPLFYACRFWGEHLQETCSPILEDLHTTLQEFLSIRLLFWTEVLNLTKNVGMGVIMLHRVQTWLLRNNQWPTTHKEVNDARKFLMQFGASTCSRSTPHIYISVLPACPRTSSVYENYQKYTRGLTSDVLGLVPAEKAQTELVSFNEESVVYSVAFSPDGTRIVSGAASKAIQAWSVYDRTKISKPLLGHSRSILSIAISLDGAFVVSGSLDKTVRVWDPYTATALGKPLEGHTGSVNSVAVSQTQPTLIASGSSDKTIMLWDIQSFTQHGIPLEGHTGAVNSVAFSPTCAQLGSGSADGTIRIWDSLSGTLSFQPILGHLGSINSVAFSPDGAYIVSGSHDRTIRIWDVSNGAALGLPFNGHTDWVKSVAFGPDCTRVVSGSFDRTTRLWDVSTGKQIGRPFEGHTGWVSSASFSPNGAYIVSSSSDKTIRLWDAYPDGGNDLPSEHHAGPRSNYTSAGGGNRRSRILKNLRGIHTSVGSVHSQIFKTLWDIHTNPIFERTSLGRVFEPPDLNKLEKPKPIVDDYTMGTPGRDSEFRAVSTLADDSRIVSVKASKVRAKGADGRDAKMKLDGSLHIQEVVLAGFSPSCIRIVLRMTGIGGTVQVWEVNLPGSESTLTELDSKTKELKFKIEQLESEIKELKPRRSELRSQIQELEFSTGMHVALRSKFKEGEAKDRELKLKSEELKGLQSELRRLDPSSFTGPVTLTGDGWLKGINGEMLFWIPRALHRDTMLLRSPHLLFAACDIAFGHSPPDLNLALGTEWSKCYVS